jgi:parallel beta-helix repeat protein
VTAPSAPGTYNFQWRMLQEGIEWFGEFGDNVPVTVGTIRVCEAIRALAGTNTDASGAIQTCINDTPSGETLELPAGIYRMDSQVQISARPITLRTEGKNESMPKCTIDAHDCAELKASTSFTDTVGILRMLSPGTTVDHIVVNGNKVDRRSTTSGDGCAAGNNQFGYNIQLACNNCTLTNSVTKNALCGTGCEVSGVRSNVRVWRNTIAYNGVHNLQGLWADGLTVHDAADSTFTENEAVDNTDVDIIFGGCQNCVIQNNTIWHTDAFEGSSFAALMLHAWSNGATSGNYNGTVTSGNTVDCGSQRQCGIGLYIGPDAWYEAPTFGGSVHDNAIDNAQFGLLIDDANDMEVYNNPVTNPAAMTDTDDCGWELAYDYGIGVDSANIDTSLDTLGTSYHSVDYDGCIPNWWN